MTDELKPCPLCGGEAKRITIDEPGDNFGGDVITCTRCGASSHVEFGYKENLVDHWNTRAVPDRVERYKAALKRIATVDMGGGFLGAQACREVARDALGDTPA